MSARFQEAVLLRLSTGLREAIDRAADAEHSKRTDFIRRAIVERLRKDSRARASPVDLSAQAELACLPRQHLT